MVGSKGARVADLWVTSGSEEGWNFSFGRHFDDWELEVQGFLCTVSSKSINPNFNDRLLWKEAKNGSFFVKTCFDLLEGGRQQLVPFKMLWNPIVPTKVVSLLGKFAWDRILTLDQLKKRGFSLASRCPLCGKVEETLEHLLIHCPKVWCMWTALFSLLGGGKRTKCWEISVKYRQYFNY